jgi:hypothetical protein
MMPIRVRPVSYRMPMVQPDIPADIENNDPERSAEPEASQ